MMQRWVAFVSAGRGSLVAVLLASAVACNCSGGGGGNSPRDPNGSGSGSAALDPRCEAARPQLEALYRTEAQAAGGDAARVDEAVRDNSAMVLAECNRRPEVAACAAKAATAAQLEAECLTPLDDEGSEGTSIRR